MTLLEILPKDRRFWTEAELEEMRLFFELHPFFTKFYQQEDFQDVVALCYYAAVQCGEEFRLQLNRKSQIFILLSGQATVYRKLTESEAKKRMGKRQIELLHGQYLKIREYREVNQVVEAKNELLLIATSSTLLQIVYVPVMLYEAHLRKVTQRRMQRIIAILQTVFPNAPRKDLQILAESGSYFKDFKMNSVIYRAGSQPDCCYVIVKGNVKLESTISSAKRLLERSVIGERAVFGDVDINLQARIQHSFCCSAYCKLLILRKQAYNRFISRNIKSIQPHLPLPPRIGHSKSLTEDSISLRLDQVYGKKQGLRSDKLILPKLSKFHSFIGGEEEQKIQKSLVDNCHVLMNLSPESHSKSSFRMPQRASDRDYSISQFQRKLSLFKRLKSGKSQLAPRLF